MAEKESRKPEPKAKQSDKAPLYRNGISFAGGLIVLASAILIFLSLLIDINEGRTNPYMGIFTYLVFPGVLFFGVLLILLGMRFEASRRKRTQKLPELPYPRLDLNDRHQRRMFVLFAVGGAVMTILIGWASYKGFHYTESVEFCGETCHVPMEPEYVAYQESAHARVACVDCHVGEGADWYVKSKFSGARQVLAVITGDYQRPIPTPIEHLRPARETCERCHWPAKFFGARMMQLPHFRYNEENTAEQISLMLKTGGGDPAEGQSSGIHWHMLLSNTVEFVATDQHLQNIPWIRVTHADGSQTVYRDRGSDLSDAEIAELEVHEMDCMDCHNRPAHNFPTPDSGVDEAMLRGVIPSDLPWFKLVSVNLLHDDYESAEQAHEAIRTGVMTFYREEHPEVARERGDDLEQAIEATIAIWERGVFPEMNVDWSTYPNNIGHRYWPGCFRCHDGQHVSDDGRVVARDCSETCHSEPQRGPLAGLGAVSPMAEDDWHPWAMPEEHIDIAGHDVVLCPECHGAGARPSTEGCECLEE